MELPARIFIVDDDENSDHALLRVLTRAGFDCCGTGTENSIVARLTSEPDPIAALCLFRPFTTNEILVTISKALRATFEQPVLEQPVLEQAVLEQALLENAVFEKLVHHLGGPDLTRRELQVLRLMAAGMPNKAIADRLFVSLHTARNHVKSILRKLGAHSRLEAVAIAVHGGYTERDMADGAELAS
jgi:DNA-binding CsgD family transcriptional regulator